MTIAAVLIASVLLSQCDDNQSLPNRAARRELSAEEAAAVAAEARAAVDAFLEAWNTGSSAELAEVVGFPFVTLRGDGRVRIDGSPETFQPRYFERIRETEQWNHSTYDAIEPVWVFDNKVHFKVQKIYVEVTAPLSALQESTRDESFSIKEAIPIMQSPIWLLGDAAQHYSALRRKAIMKHLNPQLQTLMKDEDFKRSQPLLFGEDFG